MKSQSVHVRKCSLVFYVQIHVKIHTVLKAVKLGLLKFSHLQRFLSHYPSEPGDLGAGKGSVGGGRWQLDT
jgi:hypothetical protein